jgi:hypothetical protein
MDQARPRSEFLHDAGLVVLPGQIRPRQGRAWLVDWQGTRGVLRRTAVPADEARAIPVYMRGRGLQMIAKRVRAGRPETGMLAEVQWLGMNAAAVGDALAAAAS